MTEQTKPKRTRNPKAQTKGGPVRVAVGQEMLDNIKKIRDGNAREAVKSVVLQFAALRGDVQSMTDKLEDVLEVLETYADAQIEVNDKAEQGRLALAAIMVSNELSLADIVLIAKQLEGELIDKIADSGDELAAVIDELDGATEGLAKDMGAVVEDRPAKDKADEYKPVDATDIEGGK